MPSETPADLAAARYDLLVIGGGIHGLFAAYDAAQRGLSVALVERADFGSGLSFNHQRTIHGGLRALGTRPGRQDAASDRTSGAPGRASRRTCSARCPSWSAPTVGRTRSRWAVRAGFAALRPGRPIAAIATCRRNCICRRRGSNRRPRRGACSRASSEAGLSGGAIWYDYQTRHPDRLNWTVALAARQAGARLANWTRGDRAAAGRAAGSPARACATAHRPRARRRGDASRSLAAGSGLRPWDRHSASPARRRCFAR